MICNIWLLPSRHILQVGLGLDAVNLLLPFGPLCKFTPYLFCMHKEVFEWFCHNKDLREKKNSKTMTQKKIAGCIGVCNEFYMINWVTLCKEC